MQRLQIARAAGIVHEDVERAEMLDRPVDEAFDIGLRHCIAGEEHRAVACADLVQRGLRLVRVARHQRHARAFGQIGLGDAAPDPRRAAGDRGDLAFQFHSRLSLASVARRGRTRAQPFKKGSCRRAAAHPLTRG